MDILFVKARLWQETERFRERAHTATDFLWNRLHPYWMQVTHYTQALYQGIRAAFLAPTPNNDRLPPQLLARVFGLLNRLEDTQSLKNVRLVCKSWSNASNEPSLAARRIAFTIMNRYNPVSAIKEPVPSLDAAKIVSLALRYRLSHYTQRDIKNFIKRYDNTILQQTIPLAQNREWSVNSLTELTIAYNALFQPKHPLFRYPSGEYLATIGFLVTSPHAASRTKLANTSMNNLIWYCRTPACGRPFFEAWRLALLAKATHIIKHKDGEATAMAYLRALNLLQIEPPRRPPAPFVQKALAFVAKNIACIDVRLAKQLIARAKALISPALSKEASHAAWNFIYQAEAAFDPQSACASAVNTVMPGRLERCMHLIEQGKAIPTAETPTPLNERWLLYAEKLLAEADLVSPQQQELNNLVQELMSRMTRLGY